METLTGILIGEQCNRNGCKGVIDEHQLEGCCSCHINPPCSYCTTSKEYCPECGWYSSEEPVPQPSSNVLNEWQRQNEERNKQRDLFWTKFRTGEAIDKLEMVQQNHTHFSQAIFGIFPSGTETRETILPKVKGTFGGRFARFGETDFEYIAYTD